MKKLISFLILIAFIYNSNAQINNSTGKNIVVQPKINAQLISPLNDNLHQKSFEEFGWVNSYYYTYGLGITNFNSLCNIINAAFTLFPDSTMTTHFGDEVDFCGMHAIGFAFDPYSKSLDSSMNLENSWIMPSPPNLTHPYIVDSILLQGLYFEGTKNIYSNRDTLRIYINYLKPYKGTGDEYRLFHYYTDLLKDTHLLVPKVSVIKTDLERGADIMPSISNTITIDYVLPQKYSKDTIVNGEKKLYYTLYKIPLNYNGITENGLEIDAGGVLCVTVKFLPGYEYQFGDTLHYGEKNPNKEGYYAEGYPIFVNNEFRLFCAYREDNNEKLIYKAFADPCGYNTTYAEYTDLHYQTYTDSNAFRNSYYISNTNFIPVISYHLNIDKEKFDTANYITTKNDIISKIYPNPANDNITIQLKNVDQATITLYNLVGQEVKSVTSSNLETTVNVSDLQPGIYIIKIDQKGKRFTSKISIR